MIYTFTPNPSLDYHVRANGIIQGEVNRLKDEQIFAGGKGINVSLVLRELGVESTALGFVAGFTGAKIEAEVNKSGIKSDFIRLSRGFSRINVKIRAEKETELNGEGPEVYKAELFELFSKLDKLKPGDTLVLAGSLQPSLPNDLYEQILSRICAGGIRTAVDTTGDALLGTLKYRPYLIKPNNKELGELFGVEVSTYSAAAEYGRRLSDMGAENVLVSMGEKGAVLIAQDGAEYIEKAFKGEVKNSVGAGDSMLAGFLAGADRGVSYALRLGSAAGAAAAFSDGPAKSAEILRLLKQRYDEI